MVFIENGNLVEHISLPKSGTVDFLKDEKS